jgi:hypothetical protein
MIYSADLAQPENEAIILAKLLSKPEMKHIPACRNIRRDMDRGILKSLPEMLNAGLDLIILFNDENPENLQRSPTEDDILHEVRRGTVVIDDISVLLYFDFVERIGVLCSLMMSSIMTLPKTLESIKLTKSMQK